MDTQTTDNLKASQAPEAQAAPQAAPQPEPQPQVTSTETYNQTVYTSTAQPMKKSLAKSIVCLVLGVHALYFGIFLGWCYGIGVIFGVGCAIAEMIISKQMKEQNYEQGQMRSIGDKLATAGLIVCIAIVGIGILIVIGIILMAILGAMSSAVSNAFN